MKINYPISRRHDFEHTLIIHFNEDCGFTLDDALNWFKINKIPYQQPETWVDTADLHLSAKFKFKNPEHAMRFKLAFNGEYKDYDEDRKLD
jgi:hypothetical protein